MSEYIKIVRAGPSITVLYKGGPGSGNFGHSGRPGEVGGSGEGGGGSEWADKLSDNEKSAWHAWVTDSSRISTEQIDVINESLKKAPDYKGTVFRGRGGLDEEDLYSIIDKGTIISFDRPQSFSKSEKIALTFADKKTYGNEAFVIYKVEMKTTGKDVSAVNRYGEGEVASVPGAKYKVTGSEEMKIGEKYGYLVQLEEQ